MIMPEKLSALLDVLKSLVASEFDAMFKITQDVQNEQNSNILKRQHLEIVG